MKKNIITNNWRNEVKEDFANAIVEAKLDEKLRDKLLLSVKNLMRVGNISLTDTDLHNLINTLQSQIDVLKEEQETQADLMQRNRASGVVFSVATETTAGMVKIATDDDLVNGVNAVSMVTPKNLKTYLAKTGGGGTGVAVLDATETTKGISEIATQSEVNAGTDDNKIVTPKKIKPLIDDLKNDTTALENNTKAKTAELGRVDDGLRKDVDTNINDIAQLKAKETADIKGVVDQIAKLKNTDTDGLTKAISDLAKKEKSDIAGIKTQQQTNTTDINDLKNKTVTLIDATETTKGISEIATQAEVNAGTDDSKIVTPKKLKTITGDLDSRATRIRNDVDRNTADLVTHRTDIQQNTTDIVSNTASIATIITTIKKGITTTADKLAQSFTVPAVLHDKVEVKGEDTAGHYGYAVAMHNDYLAISDPVLQEVVIYHRDKNNKKIFNLEDIHKGKKHGAIFVEDGQVYAKRKDGKYLDVFEYDEAQATLTFKKVNTINLTLSYGNSLAINDDYLIVGNPQFKTVLIYKHSGIQWQLVKQLTGGDSFGSSVAVTDNYIIIAEPDNKKIEAFDLNFNKVKTITGGASFGKLIDYSSKALAIAETDNSKVSFYKDELVPTTIKDIILEKKITGENLGYNQFVNDRWWVIGSDKNSFFDIYENVKGTWTKKQRFSDTRGDFGDDISIYDNTMVLGSDKNYIKIYDYDGNNWVFKKEITGSGNFGRSVSIYKDTLVIGAYSGNYVEIWQRVNNIWSKVKTLNGSGNFGSSVSIYKDTLVIGAYSGNYVEIWQRVNNIWSKVKTLNGSGNFGSSVSIYKDTLVIGAYGGNYAEIWQRVNNIWSKVKTLNGSGSFGISVSIYKDTLVIGAYSGNYVEIWQRVNNIWSKVKTLNGSDSFGYRLKHKTDKFITIGSRHGSYSELYKINYNLEQKLIDVGVYNKNTDSIAVTNDNLLVVDKTNTTANIYDDKALLKSFTIDTNYGDACAITTDKILITNKTDSKLAIYDHAGTKQKEIQLETGVGSVIDATDTEAIVGSETANTVDIVSLT